MPELPKILTRTALCNSRLFRVEAADIRFSNGEERSYEYLKTGGNGAVIIVPMISENEFLLVQEYGIGVEGYEWGLPKGKVDDGESFEQAANREMKEEVGYGARDVQRLKGITLSPSYMQHETEIVIAKDLYPESLAGDEPEPLAVQRFHFDELFELSMREDVTEARSIAALFMAREYLRSK